MMDKTIPKDAGIATFAGGCFWCMEAAFETLKGVYDAVSGYTGGTTHKPSYAEVSSGKTGHVEAVHVYFNPKIVSYKQLLDVFWKSIDPTDDKGQFADKGSQYRTAIFYHDENQKKLAEASKKALEASKKFSKPITTKILPLKEFFKAEDYHQNYHRKHALQYNLYKFASGRENFLKKVWGKKDGKEK